MLRVRRRAARVAALVAGCVVLLAGARAWADRVDDLIALLSKKPSGMSSDTWREKRREAARELGRLGDKRAVEPLIKIVETEKFDAILEIAIEALGRLGDKRAVEPLRRIWRDEGRDRYVRQAAADALRSLGEDPEGERPPPEPEPEPEPEPARTPARAPAASPTTGALGATEAAEPEEDDGAALEVVDVPEASRFGADVIAASERFTFAVGSLALTYDSLLDQPQLSGNASARYRRGLEKPSFGYSVDAGVAFAGGAQDRDFEASDTSSFAFTLAAVGATEMRFYLGRPGGLFAHVEGGVGLEAQGVVIETAMPGNADFDEFLPSLDLTLGLGGGWGRTVDVGSRLRLKRVEAVLRRARLLGRPIHADVAARVETAWWNLRGELGSWRRLKATIQILREAGVLLQEPDPITVYQLLRVLEDGQLDERLDGWDVRVGVGELFLGRDDVGADDGFALGRQEIAFVRARVARQLTASDAELVATGAASYKLSGDDALAPFVMDYLAAFELTWRKYFHGVAWDPRGALEFGARVGASDLDTDDDFGPATLLGARVGYTIFPNRASRLTMSGDVSLVNDTLFVGIRLGGTFALLPATYTAW